MKNRKIILVILISLSVQVFAQHADLSLIPYRKGNLWGYATPDKKIVIKPVYADANLFHAGFASVKKGARYGYINASGKLVIPFRFFSAKPFRYGYMDNLKTQKADTVLFAGAAIKSDSVERCIDTRGNLMAKCPAINEDNAPINDKPLMADTAVSSFSTLVKSETFDKVLEQYKLGSDDTYYIAMKNGHYGVINNKLEMIVPFEYTSISKQVISGSIYLLADKGGMKGLFTGNGTVLLNTEYSRLDGIKADNGNDYFILAKNGNTGLKDLILQDQLDLKYADISYDTNGGFILTAKDNLKGCYFLNKKILEPKYTEIKMLYTGSYVLIKTQDGKSGYISNEGVEFFEE